MNTYVYKFLFYLQREPIIPRHYQMVLGLKKQLDRDPRVQSVKERLDSIDFIPAAKLNVINEWCRKNKIKLELLICTQGITFKDRVDFVIGYGLGKYFTRYLTNLGIYYIDLASDRDLYESLVNKNQAVDYILDKVVYRDEPNRICLPQFIHPDYFEYVEQDNRYGKAI